MYGEPCWTWSLLLSFIRVNWTRYEISSSPNRRRSSGCWMSSRGNDTTSAGIEIWQGHLIGYHMTTMDLARASPFPLTYSILFFLLLPITSSCPLLRQRLCDAANASDPISLRCGEHVFSCGGAVGGVLGQIKLYGEGTWLNIPEFSYDERVLVVQDHGIDLLLRHYDCGIVYSFPPPAPPLPRPGPFQDSFRSGFHLFNCEVGTYNFSRDVFAQAYGSARCSGFDLYYAFEYPGEQLGGDAPANCAGGSSIFEWRLQFDWSGRNLSVLSAGISHQRKLLPDCFDCRMARRDCSPVGAGNATSCICGRTCSEASLEEATAKRKLILGVGAAIVGFVLLCIFILSYYVRHKIYLLFNKWKSRNIRNVEDFLEQYGSLIPKRYSYSDVKKMTKFFNNKLGEGAYGKVFKGKLQNSYAVAVKILNEYKGNGEEFVNEVASIGRTYHVNIVRLIGFCSEGTKRALIYEFMPNGSLEKLIFSAEPRDLVGWRKLYDIAIGIAHGLEYLHHGCNIVHFDIKPHNILLDQDFCPKISDFGLAKLCRPKESKLSMAGTRGTIGYIAPEIFSRIFGAVSTKSDVYSYGMMLLEMVNGGKTVDARLENNSETYFPYWVYEQLLQDGHLEISDITRETEEVARKMVIVGLWCIQTNPKIRPSMSNVVEMLTGNIEDLKMPPRPHLSSPVASCCHSSYQSITSTL